MNKILIYQVITRLFGNDNFCTHDGCYAKNGSGKMSDFNEKALSSIKEMGFSHIWYTGIIRHATTTDYSKYGIEPQHKAIVKGKAGSPYAITDYYDVDPDLADNPADRIKEFEELVKRTHKAKLKVVIDFVPNHVARQYKSVAKPKGVNDFGEGDDSTKAFSPSNNFYYLPNENLALSFDAQQGADAPYTESPAKVTGNDKFGNYPNISDWYDTVKLNYGVDYMNNHECHFTPIPKTWKQMLDILKYWTGKGVDAFRCDMAEMVPVEFWAWVIPQIKKINPDILFIAEIYNPNEYNTYFSKGKFDYLYDKVGLYDQLRRIITSQGSANALTNCWQSLGELADKMLTFTENHDEQRLASNFVVGNGHKARPASIVAATINTNPFMIYFGQELGEHGMDCEGYSGYDGRTTIFDYWSVDTIKRWRNNGKYDEEQLTESERDLRSFYCRLLNICNTEPAINKGQFFDLMYANLGSWSLNEHRNYAYFRKSGKEVILVIVNFDDLPARIGLKIPDHAFEFLKIPESKTFEATDLLSGEKESVTLDKDRTFTTNVPGNFAKILKFKL